MALGIYLDFFVKKIDVGNKVSKDILQIANNNRIEHVLGFNYINNYVKYDYRPEIIRDTCFVHGEVGYADEIRRCRQENARTDDSLPAIDEIIRKNKMIIGFDEYRDDDRKNDQLDFVYYRKYFQRISKGTGSQYLDWLDKYKTEIRRKNISRNTNESLETAYDNLVRREAKKKPNHIFIFGHSMDATDKDIFRDMLLREPNDTKITIYYHDDAAHDRIIVNLIRMLSQEVLIRKTHGSNPDIELIRQKD